MLDTYTMAKELLRERKSVAGLSFVGSVRLNAFCCACSYSLQELASTQLQVEVRKLLNRAHARALPPPSCCCFPARRQC